MVNRIIKLREKMKNKNLEAILISQPDNRRYLSGFTGSTAYLLITLEKTILVTDSRYTEQASNQTEFEVIEHKKSALDTVKEKLDQLRITRLGIEENFITLSEHNKIHERLQKELIPLEGMIEEIRTIKDEDEIKNIKAACSLGDRAFSYMLGLVKPDVTEKELAVELEYFLKKNGAEALSFDTIVAAGPRTSLPHAEPSENKIQNGDFVLFDFGCKVNGYCSDMTRTVVVGHASDEQRKIYDTVLNAQKSALEFITSGKRGNEVDKVARDFISKSGYGDKFGHGLGHSVGLYIHEEPRLSPNCDKELKSGMILTVEPGIYIEGFGGVRIEDMVIIRENGSENLMNSPKQLIVI